MVSTAILKRVRARRAFTEGRRDRLALAPVAQTMLHFALELWHQRGRHLLDMRAQIIGIQVLASEVARIHEVEHRTQDLDDRLARWQITLRDAAAALIAEVAREQLSRNLVDPGGTGLG